MKTTLKKIGMVYWGNICRFWVRKYHFLQLFSKQGSLEELFIAPAKTTKNDGISRGNSTAGVEYLAGSFSKATTVNGIDSVEKVQNTSEHKEIVTEQIKQLR